MADWVPTRLAYLPIATIATIHMSMGMIKVYIVYIGIMFIAIIYTITTTNTPIVIIVWMCLMYAWLECELFV